MGKLLIGHFDVVRHESAYTAKALASKIGYSIITGHTHRGGVYYKRVYDKEIVGFENFCLCDLNPPYTQRPNWQQGFCIVYRIGDLFHISPHPIIDGRTFYKGQLVTA